MSSSLIQITNPRFYIANNLEKLTGEWFPKFLFGIGIFNLILFGKVYPGWLWFGLVELNFIWFGKLYPGWLWFGLVCFGWVWLLPCSRVWFLVSTAVSLFLSVLTSVCNTQSLSDPDPNPDPSSDPTVFGPPGSGSTKQK
jgi:hypothetical protein